MSDKKQTAVEWFYDKIKSHFEHDGDLLETLTFTMSIAKKMEREQIEEVAMYHKDSAVEIDCIRSYMKKNYGGKDE
jgi:hypothetical protein